jgi:hypothetical protein
MRLRLRRIVDLPQPEGPISAVISFGKSAGSRFHGQAWPVVDRDVVEVENTSLASSFPLMLCRSSDSYQLFRIEREAKWPPS